MSAIVFGRESPRKVVRTASKQHYWNSRTSIYPATFFPNIKNIYIVFGQKSGTTMTVPVVTVPTPLRRVYYRAIKKLVYT